MTSSTFPLREARWSEIGTCIRSPTPVDPERKILSASSRYFTSVIDRPISLAVSFPVGRRVLGAVVLRSCIAGSQTHWSRT